MSIILFISCFPVSFKLDIFRLLVLIITYSFYLSTSIFSYSLNPSFWFQFVSYYSMLFNSLSLCESIFHTSSICEFPGEMPTNFYPAQIEHWCQTKETIPPKSSFVNQWVYWGSLQDHDSLKGHHISGKVSPMKYNSWRLQPWISLHTLQSTPSEESLLPR